MGRTRRGASRLAPGLVLVALAVALVACDAAPNPSGTAGATLPTGSSSLQPSTSPGVSVPGSPVAGASISPSAPPMTTAPLGSVAPPPSVKPFTPPPVMEPLEDEICLELASRNAVQGALGRNVGDITAEGTDPNVALTCTYAVPSGGQLLLMTTIADSSAYDTELDLAVAYGQDPEALSGVGDQAFYAAATADAPEQLVFTKGPVLVRFWNQTPATIGRAAFRALAVDVAFHIRAEIPPAP
jgi:hypothetical protein